jgi:acyl carrier protein
MKQTEIVTDDRTAILIKDILQYKLGLEENQVADHARFSDDLGVDSLDMIEIHMEIEKKFSVRIEDEVAEKLTTVGSLVTYIRNKSSLN